MRRLFGVFCSIVALSTLLSLLGPLYGPVGVYSSRGEIAAASPLQAEEDPRYFRETGFRISDDRFWDYFNKRGGTRTFGLPVSRKFNLLGFEVQFFQRRIMQLQGNNVVLLNLLDEGLMPYNSVNYARLPAPDPTVVAAAPPPTSTNYSVNILRFVQDNSPDSFQSMDVRFYRAYADTVRFLEAYPDGVGDPNWMAGINFEMWGVPTSKPTLDPNNSDFVYLRFQRGILHYDKKSNVTQGMLLADYLKSIITGANLPGDLEAQASTSKYYKQYNNALPNGMNRPNDLPATDMKNAFEREPAPGEPTPTATPTPAASPTPAPGSTTPTTGLRYGMQAHLIGQDQPRVMQMLRGAGFSWMKQQIRWTDIEGSKGAYNWGITDSMVANAQAQGVNLLFSVVAAPGWATGNNPVAGPPSNYDELAGFMGALASRYRGRVQAYEVWNEQNLWYEWGGYGRLNAASYVDMLRRSYAAIKAADPSAIVVSGALTPTGVNDAYNAIDDVVYLDQMYQAGLKNYTDAIGAHMAGYNNAPDDWVDRNTVNTPGYKGHGSFYFRRIDQLYEVMQRHGDNKQLWLTEFEWGSIDRLPDNLRSYDWTTHLNEQTVASFHVQAIQSIRTSRPWVGAVFVWNLNWRTFSDPYKLEQAIFGILNSDWSPRLIYIALRDMPK
ncbi:MAG: hypothetical protein HY675_15365 [Chloroflexi bacterium]|nr:hypothetical protein [Chloroflexota bacterium]